MDTQVNEPEVVSVPKSKGFEGTKQFFRRFVEMRINELSELIKEEGVGSSLPGEWIIEDLGSHFKVMGIHGNWDQVLITLRETVKTRMFLSAEMRSESLNLCDRLKELYAGFQESNVE